MNFRVGQKVVCISDNWNNVAWVTNKPAKDAIYTVRAIQLSDLEIKVGLRLEEILNPISRFIDFTGEPAFDARFFRPLIERKTDISIFTRMLTPNARQHERA